MDKFIELISSSRFQQLVLIGIIQSLVLFGVISTEQGTGLANIVSYILAASVTIGTIDKNSGQAKVEAAKLSSGNTVVSMPENTSTVTATTTKRSSAKKK